MAVDRLLPTAEARDLLALVRDIADKELAPRVEEHERTETYPEGLFAHARRGGSAGAALPGGVGRRRPALRGVPAGAGGAGQPVGGGRGRGERAGPRLPPDRRLRLARAAGALAAAAARGRAARGLLAVRAAGRVRRRGARVQGRAHRRRLPDHRHEGVDHPRRQGRPLRALRPHRAGQRRGLVLPRAGPRRGAVVRQAGAEDGAARDPDGHRALGRRGDRRRPARRPRGPGPADRVQRARLRQAGHRRRGHRASRRPRWTRPSTTPTSARRSAGRSSTTRGWASCSPTWPRPSTPPAPPTSTPPAAATRACAYSRQASVAKLVASDAAMKVTTDAVQVLGGYGYTRDFPVERYMREAKITQIFEGTNQIQRLVISRGLARPMSFRRRRRSAFRGGRRRARSDASRTCLPAAHGDDRRPGDRALRGRGLAGRHRDDRARIGRPVLRARRPSAVRRGRHPVHGRPRAGVASTTPASRTRCWWRCRGGNAAGRFPITQAAPARSPGIT